MVVVVWFNTEQLSVWLKNDLPKRLVTNLLICLHPLKSISGKEESEGFQIN